MSNGYYKHNASLSKGSTSNSICPLDAAILFFVHRVILLCLKHVRGYLVKKLSKGSKQSIAGGMVFFWNGTLSFFKPFIVYIVNCIVLFLDSKIDRKMACAVIWYVPVISDGSCRQARGPTLAKSAYEISKSTLISLDF